MTALSQASVDRSPVPSAEVLAFLRKDPLSNVFLLEYALTDSTEGGQRMWASVLDEDGRTLGVATADAPYPTHLSSLEDGVPTEALDGLVGLPDRAQAPAAVAQRLLRSVGGSAQWQESDSFNVYFMTAKTIRPFPGVDGSLRPAGPEDLAFIEEGLAEFAKAFPDRSPNISEYACLAVEAGMAYVWSVHGRAVSMALRQPPVDEIVHVSAGYTPEHLRGEGYSRACVAAVCQSAFDDGYSHCLGVVDTRNVPANKAYMAAGYVRHHLAIEAVRVRNLKGASPHRWVNSGSP